MLVVRPKHGGGPPLGIDLDAGTASIVVPSPPESSGATAAGRADRPRRRSRRWHRLELSRPARRAPPPRPPRQPRQPITDLDHGRTVTTKSMSSPTRPHRVTRAPFCRAVRRASVAGVPAAVTYAAAPLSAARSAAARARWWPTTYPATTMATAPEGDHHPHDPGHQHRAAAPFAAGQPAQAHDGARPARGRPGPGPAAAPLTSQSASGRAATRTVTVTSSGRRCTATLAPRGALPVAWATAAWSPRAACRATADAVSMQRSCRITRRSPSTS